MTELLTTKQVQALLHVDRTTIYRMVEGGQLPAVRVGKQWRFAREEVERSLRTARALPAGLATPAPVEAQGELEAILPPVCVQSVQDAFAELLGVTLVITDMEGRPVTRMSNPCGFFDALMTDNPEGLQHCIHTWQQMAGNVALDPKFSQSEMGLLCARGLIRVGPALKGMVVIGGIAPDAWPPSAEQTDALAELFGVQPEVVMTNAEAVFRMDRAAQERALRFVQRVADIFSQMIRDRLDLQGLEVG